MKKSRFPEEQIAFALKQAETGTPVAEVVRRTGTSEQTFYRWKKLYGGLSTASCAGCPEPVALHLPGILGLVVGYPVVMDRGHVRLNVHPELSENEAIAANEASLPFDEIGSVEADGTAVFSSKTITALRDQTCKHLDHVTVRGAADQAKVILEALG